MNDQTPRGCLAFMVSLRHKKVAAGSNNPNREVSKNAWNDEHSLTGTAGSMIVFDVDGIATEVSYEDLLARIAALEAGSGPTVTLGDLGGTFTLAENATAGAVAGALTGVTVGSTLSLLNDAGGMVALSGSSVIRGATVLNYESNPTPLFTVRETHPDASGPHDTILTLNVTDVAEGITVTNVSSAGTVPVVLSLDSALPLPAGFRLRWQFDDSLTPPKNSDGSYVSPTQSNVTFVDGASIGALDLALGYTDPSGPFAFHCRAYIDDESGATTLTDNLGNSFTVSPLTDWSNDYTDTISTSVTQWATGSTDKSQWMTISGAGLTAAPNTDTDGQNGVRSDNNASGKRHFELTINSHGASANGTVAFGVADDTTSLNTVSSPGGGSPGAAWALKNGIVSNTVFRNGTNVSGTSLTTALADGDKLAIEYDTTANTVSLYHKPGSGAWYLVQTLTLTSQIPANWRAYVAGFRTGDNTTANFGATAFSMTPSSGYLGMP